MIDLDLARRCFYGTRLPKCNHPDFEPCIPRGLNGCIVGKHGDFRPFGAFRRLLPRRAGKYDILVACIAWRGPMVNPEIEDLERDRVSGASPNFGPASCL